MRTNETARRSVNSAISALRTYRLIDCFDLCTLFWEDVSPSYEAVLDRLQRNEDALPPGISADHLARHILAKVGEDAQIIGDTLRNGQPPLTTADADELSAILTGTVASRKNAARYQRHVRRLVGGLFVGRLIDEGSEVRQFGGVGRIDLVFRNVATTGVFDDINRRHGVEGMYIPVECKNYEFDPENPEFAQLQQRLNAKFGMLGIIACRTVTNWDAVLARSAPAAREGKWILVLSDAEFGRMLDAHLAGDVQTVEAPLYDQVKRLALA